jgi:hypothetical protein
VRSLPCAMVVPLSSFRWISLFYVPAVGALKHMSVSFRTQ